MSKKVFRDAHCTGDTDFLMAVLHSGLLSVILQVKLVFLLFLHKLEISGLDIHEIRKNTGRSQRMKD